MTTRLYAFIDSEGPEPRTKHYIGLPPELTGGIDRRTPMARARLVVLEERGDGVYLFLFSEGGEDAGDTWHLTVEDAKDQAKFEFSSGLGEWRESVEAFSETETFARSLLAQP